MAPGQLGQPLWRVERPGREAGRVREYYASCRWRPVEDWARIDEAWLPTGEVDVGELRKLSR